ncbi:MAG: transferase [Acidobacteria bacterium]|nr:MAG: transferase [Acidobacteriota bacterium]PYY21128.1 MAG: transferase [Acidobacteriota bacterium]
MEKKGANKLAIIETEEIGPDTSIAEFAIIRKGAKLGRGVIVHPFVVIESGVSIGDGVEVYPFSHIGKEPNGAGAVAREPVFDRHVAIGAGCCIGPNAVIYCDVRIGESTLIGDGASVREKSSIGSKSIIGRHATIGYECRIGSNTKIMDHSGIAGKSVVGDRVFIANDVQSANDNLIGSKGWRDDITGPVIEDDVMIGEAAVLLPGIVVERGAIIGSGALINHNVKPDSMMLTMPARAVPRELHKE